MKNIKLNSKKLQLRKQEVPYTGPLLTLDGLKPDPNKVKTIVEVPTPTKKQSLQTQPGIITYLAKFLPNFSEVTEQLRRLSDRYVECHWNHVHENALTQESSLSQGNQSSDILTTQRKSRCNAMTQNRCLVPQSCRKVSL